MTRYLVHLFLISLAVLLVAPATSSAYSIGGSRWPGSTITYRSTMPRGFDASIASAAQVWNTSGARIKLVKARRGARAQVTISYGPTYGAAGLASLGRQSNAYLHINRGARPPKTLEDRQSMARLYAHEFGHVLGLHHSTKTNCEIMNPNAAGATGCKLPAAPDTGYFQCRMLFPDDLRGITKLYGGRARLSKLYCLLQPAPPQLRGVTFTGGGATAAPLSISWYRPKGYKPRTTIEVTVWNSGRCGAAESWKYQISRVTLPPTATSWTDSSIVYAPTKVCVQVQIVNAFEHGASALRAEMTTAMEIPGAPSVTMGAEFPNEYADYAVTTTAGTQLQAMRGEPGACPATLDMEHLLNMTRLDDTAWTIEQVPPGGSCLAFFTISSAGTPSAPTTIDVTHGVRPGG